MFQCLVSCCPKVACTCFMLVLKRIAGVSESSRRCTRSLGGWRKVTAAPWTHSSHRKPHCSSYTVSGERKKPGLNQNHYLFTFIRGMCFKYKVVSYSNFTEKKQPIRTTCILNNFHHHHLRLIQPYKDPGVGQQVTFKCAETPFGYTLHWLFNHHYMHTTNHNTSSGSEYNTHLRAL